VCALVLAHAAGASIAAQARWLARHGGVTGTCAGCATQRMQNLSYALVAQQFQPAGWQAVQHAVCIVRHESQGNPGAVNSSSGAAGLSQIELQWHPDLRRYNLLDPVDAVMAFWRLTRHGRDFYSDYDRYATYRC
jgi:hypothetical protein